ncbi:hypothetical protein [Sporomusa acidovorans]|uniref:Flagellar hook-length control protein FliK n=1 Tax=Sporomusa acidovorans (strain ATCC 49682 / DSM 3132 / Mol) TaxID=1123286 RepID=A0ABZ3J885_SPOA4|nr:hypothetical protein [Sporomusa acidovorans]OZC21210.1 hypothetical protein SPACI_20620 [Sporomusa acidovorans DSM 3132]SDE64833.1 hypothetical protein SAMN04488499_101827 [Sporomusa acidovorans]
MNVNTVNDAGSVQPASGVKAEAAPVNQQTDAAQVQPGAANKAADSSQAVAVDLENTITAKLADLGRAITGQTELLKNLPREIRELVEQLLNQNQSAAKTLPEGLVALLKSPKITNEKLGILVELIEQAAGISSETQPPSSATAKQQLLLELAEAWQGTNSGDLQQAAKVLRELATVVQSNKQLPQQQEAVGNVANPTAADGREQAPLKAVTQSGERLQQPPEQPAAARQPGILQNEQAKAVLPNRFTDGAGVSRQPATLPAQGSTPNNLPGIPVKTAVPASETLRSQDLPQILKTVGAQPELIKNLPPEIRKFILDILQQETPPAQTEQAASNQTPPAKMVAQTAQTLQAGQTSQPLQSTAAQQSQQAPTTQQVPQSRQVPPTQQVTQNQQTSQSQQASAAIAQSPEPGAGIFTVPSQSQTPQAGQLAQSLPPALTELLAALNKSKQKPSEKLELLAGTLEQTAELLMPGEPAAGQAATFRQQVARMAGVWQEKNPEDLKAASKLVQQLAEAIAKPSGVTAERQEGQKVLTLAVPLYFGEGQNVYPAYIHVYQQEEQNKKNPDRKVSETWLRVCLETENMGTVDASFRLYNENSLDVKVRFNDEQAANGFASSLDEVKSQLAKLPFTLGEFLVK